MECTQYKIKGWEKHQHYKERNPPWIKLHNSTLTSEDWVMLDDASRVLMVACMLLASRTDCAGVISGNAEYIQRVAYLHQLPDFAPLLKCGFIEPYGDLHTNASKLHTNARPETETETETETEERQINVPSDEFSSWWKRYPKKVAKQKCERLFSKLSKSDRLAASGDAYDLWLGYWSTIDDTQFIPHPHTWLSQHRWDTSPPQKRPQCANNRAGEHTDSESFHLEDVFDYQDDPLWSSFVEFVLTQPPGAGLRFLEWKGSQN